MEHESVYEDIGYKREPMTEHNSRMVETLKKQPKIKIECIRGMLKGEIWLIGEEKAQELIRSRYWKRYE